MANDFFPILHTSNASNMRSPGFVLLGHIENSNDNFPKEVL